MVKATRAALGAAGVVLALAACSGGSGAAANSTASPASTLHDVPSGTQLKAVLLTTTSLPTGYAEEPAGAQNSGANLSTAAASVNLTSASCETILNTVGHSGFGEAAYASNAFTPASALGEFDETVLEFHGSASTTFTNQLGAALSRCTSFQASDETGATAHASIAIVKGPRIGNESIGFTVKVPIAGQTMTMNGSIVRMGTAVAIVENAQLSGGDGISINTLATKLVQQLGALG
jgi:hypothetical protein